MANITKRALSLRIADLAGLTTQDAQKAVDGFVRAVEDALADGDTITLSGFGRFYVGTRAAHLGVNPRTGEAIPIPSSKAPRFTAGTYFKQRIRANDS